MKNNNKKYHTILIFAENKRGVVERISMLIRRKRYNLEQITASDTEKKGIKRLTLSFSHKEGVRIPKIIKQIKKIIEVLEVSQVCQKKDITTEVALIKIAKPKDMSLLNKITSSENISIIKSSDDELIIQAVGNPERILDIKKQVEKDFDLKEFGSSGAVAMVV